MAGVSGRLSVAGMAATDRPARTHLTDARARRVNTSPGDAATPTGIGLISSRLRRTTF
ncbi:hypothetical protein [uncultured Jannaschia sp.]|uniref:hypothetical protein n=1 Tax=uncultured Jannaschia sp. TaxID=293347 RepID=UPI002617F39D|nr:hypothetical protein [uncultured Jannaschia sp.]